MNSKTVPFAVMLVVALIVCGGLIYIVLDSQEEITVEIKMKSGKVPTYNEYGGQHTIVVDCYVYYTSSKDRDVTAYSVPDFVLLKDGGEKILHARPSSLYIVPTESNPVTVKSGDPIITKIGYELDGPLDLSQYTYRFQLSNQMQKAGNYKLIE